MTHLVNHNVLCFSQCPLLILSLSVFSSLSCSVCSVLSLSLHDPPHTLCQYHLISYPSSPQFLYSAGRTGRAGRKGLVTAIIAKRDKVLSDAIQVCIWVEPPLHCTALYCTALYYIVLSCAVQHYPRHTILTILCFAVLYCTVLYCTTLLTSCPV